MKQLAALFATILLMFVPVAPASAASDGDELVPIEQFDKANGGKAVKPQSYRKAGKLKKAKKVKNKSKKPKKAKKTKKSKKTGKQDTPQARPQR
jgi:hypothetical protein